MGTRHLYWILTGPSFAVHVQINKKTKFSSYIRKFRWDQVQSHIWGRAYSYEEMRKY